MLFAMMNFWAHNVRNVPHLCTNRNLNRRPPERKTEEAISTLQYLTLTS